MSRTRTSAYAVLLSLLATLAGCGSSEPLSGGAGTQATRIGHVFVVIMENKDYGETFGADTAAPFLARTLASQGALIESYYGIGHVSNDNYIAMISGQGPNLATQTDCLLFIDFLGTPPAVDGQAIGQGCVYPASVPNLPDQLKAKSISWKAYMEDMGNDPGREATSCGHPGVGSVDGTQSATATDGYATRHNPFVYFHSIIDDQAYCDAHVVNLKTLDADLADADRTPQYVFITPNLCSDGHDANPCTNKDAAGSNKGGLDGINNFLTIWAPKILASPAFRKDGLLIVTFDESDYTGSQDASACCGETSVNALMAGLSGPGGGKVGAVLVSPFIKPGTVVDPAKFAYNHYSMLRTVEDIFGLDYLGYAGSAGQAGFGAEVFTAKMPEFPAKN